MGVQLNSGPPKKGGPAPDINVTPLVDVALVLLIIFMVVTPQLESDVSVTLPEILNPDPEIEQKYDPLEITIIPDEGYWVADRRRTPAELKTFLAEIRERTPSRRLSLRADVDMGFAHARKAFALVREVGYEGAALLVTKSPEGGAEEAENTSSASLGDDDAEQS